MIKGEHVIYFLVAFFLYDFVNLFHINVDFLYNIIY